MRIIRNVGLASAGAIMSIALSAGGAIADSRMFHAYLYGGNEVPVDGDTNAFGIATVAVNTTSNLCYSIFLKNAVAATAAHIHAGAAGVAGGIVVTLPINALVPLRVASCVAAPAATVTAIQDNPQNFYVNVHNAQFPGGAARGQLQ